MFNLTNRQVIAIVGPTGVGKTALAIALAQKLETCVISADSRQFYQEIPICTAQPSLMEQNGVKHHFIGSHSIQSPIDVATYVEQANQCLDALFLKHRQVVLCGGSGLFVDALCRGLHKLPPTDPEIRLELCDTLNEQGLDFLVQKLQVVDPAYYKVVDLKNPVRVMRALEVYLSTQIPFSQYFLAQRSPVSFQSFFIGLELPRETLYYHINSRVEQMLEKGLLAEISAVLNHTPNNSIIHQTVGFKEFVPFVEKKKSLSEAIELAKKNTRNYAKRQLTWFKKHKNIQWYKADEEGLVDKILAAL